MPVVIIPAYKPDEILITIVRELKIHECDVIVVDDGSGEEYESIFAEIKTIGLVIKHPENRGKGAAIKTALFCIKEEMPDIDCIGVMDADGQHLVEDMLKLLEAARKHRKALVLGVRTVGKEMPLKSRLGNQITRVVFHMVSGIKVSDTQTGLRAFGRKLVKKLLSVKGDRYEYEMNVLMTMAKAGIPIKEVPIHTVYHDESNSCSHFRRFWDSARIYKDIFKFTLSSLSSFLLDYVLFSVLLFFLPHTAGMIFAVNIFARMVSAFYNYSMNCRFVFHTKRKIKTALDYFTLATGILVLNNLILELFVQIFQISVYPAKLLTECLLFIISWLIQNYVIFRKKSTKGGRHMRRKILQVGADLVAAAVIVCGVWIVNYQIPQKGIPAVTAQEMTAKEEEKQDAEKEEKAVQPEGLEVTNIVQDTQDWHQKFADKFTDQVIVTDKTYTSPNLSIEISHFQYAMGESDLAADTDFCYTIADIYVGDISCFQTAFAQDIYGTGYSEKLTEMSDRMQAVLALNGDSYSNNQRKDNGTLIRNGVIYRNRQTTMETCVLNWDGTMEVYEPGQVDLEKLKERGAYQSWIFGPSLLDENGKVKVSFLTEDYLRESHPRTAIGYYEPGHYCMLLVEGRKDNLRGMYLEEMAKVFEDLGCQLAYNLDGGHCSFMVFDGEIANLRYHSEKEVEDGIFIMEGWK